MVWASFPDGLPCLSWAVEVEGVGSSPGTCGFCCAKDDAVAAVRLAEAIGVA